MRTQHAWPNQSWAVGNAGSPHSTHSQHNGGDSGDTQSTENSLGWAGIVKDLELEDDDTSVSAPLSAALTESRILSFVLPSAELAGGQHSQVQTLGQGSNLSGHLGTMGGAVDQNGGSSTAGFLLATQQGSKQSGSPALFLGAQQQQGRSALGSSVTAPPKFSAVVSQKACVPLALGASSTGAGGGVEKVLGMQLLESLLPPSVKCHTHKMAQHPFRFGGLLQW